MDWLATAEKHIKSAYYQFLYMLCWINHSRWLYNKVPLEKFTATVERTNRELYEKERAIYRLVVSLMHDGVLIPERSYYLHKQIAQKYNWPYIKESYDNS